MREAAAWLSDANALCRDGLPAASWPAALGRALGARRFVRLSRRRHSDNACQAGAEDKGAAAWIDSRGCRAPWADHGRAANMSGRGTGGMAGWRSGAGRRRCGSGEGI